MRFELNVFRGSIAVLCLILMVFMASLSVGAQGDWVNGDLLVRTFCPNRTTTEVTNMLDTLRISARNVRLIFDGGPWNFETNVTFPTNCAVFNAPDSPFYITNSSFITFQTNALLNGAYECFTGPGAATGTAAFAYRHAEWGPSKHRIGLGGVGDTNIAAHVNTNTSFKMASGTTATLGTVVAGTGTIVRLTTTTNDVTDIVATRSHVAGYNMTPAVNGTVTFTSNMTSSTIQSNIDLVGKYVPFGQARTFAFASGNYTSLYAALNFSGFYGGGEMTIRGDVSGGADIHSNQATFLDFSTNFAGTAFQVQGINLRQVQVQNLKIKGRHSAFPQTTVFFADTQTAIMRYSYIYSDNTNVGVALYSRDVGSMQFDRNYIGKHQIGMYGDGSRIYSLSNVTEGASNSDIGTSLVEATYLGKFDAAQPTGTTFTATAGGSTIN